MWWFHGSFVKNVVKVNFWNFQIVPAWYYFSDDEFKDNTIDFIDQKKKLLDDEEENTVRRSFMQEQSRAKKSTTTYLVKYYYYYS